VLQKLEVHTVGDVREVLQLALEPAAGSEQAGSEQAGSEPAAVLDAA
jgi:hypothetical protein